MRQTARTLVAAIVLAAVSASHGGTVLHVDDDAGAAGDGLTWATAYGFLQDALAFASNAGNGITEIRIAQGIYQPDRDEVSPTGTGDRTASFYLINGVAIRGGYAGIGAQDPDDRDIVLYETILSGDLAVDDGPGFTNIAENSYHVVYVDNNDDTSVLDGVTMTAGNADGTEEEDRSGGGMYLFFDDPVLNDCTFRGNSADDDGAGLYCYASTSTITACSFTDNVAARDGGGVHCEVTSPQLFNCAFEGNFAWGNGGGFSGEADLSICTFTANIALDDGGGAYARCDLFDCIFTENLAGNNGGGLRQWGSGALLVGCTFNSNVADLGGGVYQSGALTVSSGTFTGNMADDGAGMYSFGGGLALTETTFDQNASFEDGAGLYNNGTSPTITDCMFTANVAESSGAGIYNTAGAAPQITGSTFSANLAVSGAGIYGNDGANPTVDTCSFLGNTTTSIGAGMELRQSTATIIDSTFDGNAAVNGGGISSVTSTVTITGSTFVDNRADVTSQGEGGAISSQNQSDLTVTDCVLQANLSRRYGGGIYSDFSDATVTSCVFTGNSAETAGGGMRSFLGNISMTDCTFDGNMASGLPNGGAGGALSLQVVQDGAVSNCDFLNNAATGGAGLSAFGGALNIAQCSPVVEECTFVGNHSTEFGGAVAIVHETSDPVLVNCLFQGNTAETNGGGLHSHDGSFGTVVNGRFIENACLDLGGGISIQKSFPTFVNCLVAGNEAPYGGGVHIWQDTAAALVNCTIVDNAADEGGGIQLMCSGPPNSLTSSILRDNDAPVGANIDGRMLITYSNVEGGVPGVGNIDVDPLFADPDGADNDPATYLDNDYGLMGNSRCIDAGDNTKVPEDAVDIDGDLITLERIPWDLTGNARFFDDVLICDTGNTDFTNPMVDMGANEFVAGSPLVDCNSNVLHDQCDTALGVTPDCNNNGIPDSCDITSGFSTDCNGNTVPDECDTDVAYADASGQLSPMVTASPQSHTLIGPPLALDDVSLTFTAISELQNFNQLVDVDINGSFVGSLYCEGSFCAGSAEPEYLVVPAATYNSALAAGAGDAVITMTASESVSFACDPTNFITVDVSYRGLDLAVDIDANGTPDTCQVPGDTDGDGVVGIQDFLDVLANWGGCPAPCPPTCPGDVDFDCDVGITDVLVVLGNWT